MNTIDLATLIPRCHEASKANGWWDVKPNPGQSLMLVVSELSEALEADRTGKDLSGIGAYRHLLKEAEDGGQAVWGEATSLAQRRNELFKWKVKDTVGDELADAYIRLCDFIGGHEGPVEEIASIIKSCRGKAEYEECVDGNFGSALFGVTTAIVALMDAIEDDDLENSIAMSTMAFHHLEVITRQRGIDLATHIDLKLEFNKSRGVRHGNKAY